MPLEIRELVIRTTVDNRASQSNQSIQVGSGVLSPEEQKKMIAACVKQVMAALRSRRER